MKGHNLELSSAAIALIKNQQGLSLEKYRDESGTWIIGYGHVIRQWESFCSLITPLQAEYLLYDDIQVCETLLRETISQPLTPQQHDAMVLMLFSFAGTCLPPKAILQAVARV